MLLFNTLVEQISLANNLVDNIVDDLMSYASMRDGQLVSAVQTTTMFYCGMRAGLTNYEKLIASPTIRLDTKRIVQPHGG